MSTGSRNEEWGNGREFGGVRGPATAWTYQRPVRYASVLAGRRGICIGRKEVAISNSKGLRRLTGLTLVALSACSPAAPPAAPPPPKVSVVTLKASSVPITTELP